MLIKRSNAMETLTGFWDFLVNQVWPYWPGLMWVVIASAIAQIVKVRICTVELARENRAVFWIRRVFPLLILLMGSLLGFLWPGEASPGIEETAHKVMYFTGCSALAISMYNVLKQWVKRKYDVEFGVSSSPPPTLRY